VIFLRLSGREFKRDEKRGGRVLWLFYGSLLIRSCLLRPEQVAYPILHFGNSSTANSSTAASHPIFAMVLFHPMTGDSMWLLEEVFSGEKKAKKRLDWIPGIAAARRSGSGSTGSWPETGAGWWAHHNYAGTTALAVCSAAAGSPWCLRELPWKTKGFTLGETAQPDQGQLLQHVG